MAILDGAFGDLRKLADWFSTSPQRSSSHIDRLLRRLGRAAVPLLGRELAHADPRRRDAARECLALLASTDARDRVIAEARRVLDQAAVDEVKVCVLGLLSELGERGEARFEDPIAMQRRSAVALAAQLDSPSDVANAADLMVRQLEEDDIAKMIEALVESAPAAAALLGAELAARIDLDANLRERVVAITSKVDATAAPARRRTRPLGRATQIAVLVDASARVVVIACRKLIGERRWRRWAVLIGPSGQIDDCLHEEAVPRAPNGEDADAGPLIASLCADGYRIASTDVDHARTVVTSAARISVSRSHAPNALTSAFYVGRDLLDLGDAHLGPRRDPSTVALGRAIELIAEGAHDRAVQLLERCEPADTDAAALADHAAALAACAIATGRFADAIDPLGRAIAAEPSWPLHHWNLAVAQHALGDATSCYHALRRFVATSSRPSALHGDPEQPARITYATRMLGELERAARLAGTSLARRRRARRTTKRRAAARGSQTIVQ